MRGIIKKILGYIIGGILGLYILGIIGCIPFYNWNYAKEHGFTKWILFGEVIASTKVLAWPYYEIFGRSTSHLISALNYEYKANVILNKSEAYKEISGADMDAIIENYKKAIKEAKQVISEFLNIRYPGFRYHFKKEFIQGYELFIKNYENNMPGSILESQVLTDRWDTWFNANMRKKWQNNCVDMK